MTIQQVMLGQSAAGGGGGTDPDFANVVLLINGIGANNSTTINDDSTYAHFVTRIGTTKIVTTDADFPLGGIRMAGGGDYLQATQTGTEFTFGTGDLTVEFDYKPVSKLNLYPAVFSFFNSFGANGGFGCYDRHQSASAVFALTYNGSFPGLSSTSTPTNGTLYRMAFVRSGTTLRLFVNGVIEATNLGYNGNLNQVGSLWIGASGDSLANTNIDGLVGRFRITKGVARYTANYTPSTAPFPTS